MLVMHICVLCFTAEKSIAENFRSDKITQTIRCDESNGYLMAQFFPLTILNVAPRNGHEASTSLVSSNKHEIKIVVKRELLTLILLCAKISSLVVELMMSGGEMIADTCCLKKAICVLKPQYSFQQATTAKMLRHEIGDSARTAVLETLTGRPVASSSVQTATAVLVTVAIANPVSANLLCLIIEWECLVTTLI
ncbi:hypothetical protein KIN20_017303 [Parelaphostrongylus tenuis]|uniref:Uncharacterized protein n=1 Tax=Parelaphostrongylus tenuis TaxID=148309 RepID=A0AAD5N686_PARTN|nr:hypothetical protein KIN20_017303 [Parelaphostrongylus tenuis]